jgi:hypothetical protein
MDRREVIGFPGYLIYEDGRVWSFSFGGKFLKSKPINGYNQYGLSSGGKQYFRLAHRLVLEAFVGPCPEGMECRHLDGDTQNNHVSNLRWGTKKENYEDKRLHGTDNAGEIMAVRSSRDVKEIGDLVRRGLYSQSELARLYGVSKQQISSIKTHKRWRTF